MPYRDRDKRRAWNRRYLREVWYPRNKGKHKRFVRSAVAKVQALIQAAKAVPCADCCVQYPPCAMQFDHISGKTFTIGGVRRLGYGIERVRREIAKCEVVCANCHAVRTWTRKQMQGGGTATSAVS